MKRTDEAKLSRINISNKKTIYVEGKIDRDIINGFLTQIQKENLVQVLIFEEDNIYGKKDKIIYFLERINKDNSVSGEYLGIVDTDYDIFCDKYKDLPNLVYTDFHCMESYLANVEIINTFLKEYSDDQKQMSKLEFYSFFKLFFRFSLFFYFQISFELESNEKVCFQDASIFCDAYITKSKTIHIKKFVEHKIDSSTSCWEKFKKFIKNINIEYKKKSNLKFLHGKFLIKYIIYDIKQKNPKVRPIKDEFLINILKDKFLINKNYTDYKLFHRIEEFAS